MRVFTIYIYTYRGGGGGGGTTKVEVIFWDSRGVSQKVDNNLCITIIILVTISYECDSNAPME